MYSLPSEPISMKNNCLFISLSLLVTSFFSTASHGFYGTISTATGQTGKAAVENAESVYINPAAITYSRGYFFNFTHFNSDEAVTNNNGFAITFLDNEPDSVVPVSLGYVANTIEPKFGETLAVTQEDGSQKKASSIQSRDFYIGFANYVMGKMSMGFTFHHLSSVVNFDSSTQSFNQNNLHWGVLFTPTESLGLGLVFYDILGPSEDIPTELRLQSRLGLGANYIYKNFVRVRAEVDSAKDQNLSEPITKFGVESYVAEWLVARFGYQNNQFLKNQSYSGGLGFIGPRFHLNYAMKVDAKDRNLQSHAIDFNLPF